MRACDKQRDRLVSSPSLPAGDVAKIVVNPTRRTLTIVQAGKTRTITLPDRPSSIEVGKRGQIKITARQFGTEVLPFAGILADPQAQGAAAVVGADGLYFKRLDLGAGLAWGGEHTAVRGVALLSYAVYDNVRLSAGVTHQLYPVAGITVRF